MSRLAIGRTVARLAQKTAVQSRPQVLQRTAVLLSTKVQKYPEEGDWGPMEKEVGGDMVRGFRMKDNYPHPDRPRNSEYESAWEQDPFPGLNQGASDEAFGQHGMDKELPWLDSGKAAKMWAMGLVFFIGLGSLAYLRDAKTHVAPRTLSLIDQPKIERII
mmetsp:Transcript_32863/g.75154  ORF Transcript_32863/g.75154 Transcript_32863/m.75154 type:complete len:161 (+) Transcript_32863:7-489(+)